MTHSSVNRKYKSTEWAMPVIQNTICVFSHFHEFSWLFFLNYIGVCNSNIKKNLLHLQGSSLTKFFFFINKNGVSVDFKSYFYKNTSFFCSVTQLLLWECTFTNPLLDIKLTMRKIWHQYENTINRIKNHNKKIMKTDSIPKWVAQTKNKLNLAS